jgi:hypothetical protein
MPHRRAYRVLCEFIELLNSFTVYVEVTGVTQDLDETSFVDFARNDFGGERQAGQKSCEIARRAWM